MSVPVWCGDLAAAFWRAGRPPGYPRDVTDAAVFGFDLSVTALPRLSVRVVREWFADQRVPLMLGLPDRRLRACLYAARGRGFVFVCDSDPADERRFSVAHEVAHFLRDYWHPRETALARLGESIRGVLDGDRPPTPHERIAGVLRHASTGPFTHLLRRDDGGRPLSAAEREAEDAADRLAFELLAPAADVPPLSRDALTQHLVTAFGLPPGPAARYAAVLDPGPPPVSPTWGRIVSAVRSG